jgi:beta-galactosidase
MRFPDDFKFGWSQSGFQFEMGGKGPLDSNSDWFAWVHDKENIIGGLVSGDLPEKGVGYLSDYHKYHLNAQEMSLNTVRIGIEWSRLIPEKRKVDEKAVQTYREILKDLKNLGFHVILNLYHWSMPLWVHDPISVRKGENGEKGGWLNESTVDHFKKFVDDSVRYFDDLVDEYVIVNEPNVIWKAGFVLVKMGFPPSYLSLEKANIARRNLISATNEAYNAIKSLTKKKVGVVYAMADIQCQDRLVQDKAKMDEEYYFLDSTKWDWLGVNYYTRIVVEPLEDGFLVKRGLGMYAQGLQLSLEGRDVSDNGWEFYPEGLYNVLVDAWRRYGKEIYVTENGVADSQDRLRPKYIVSHLYYVKKAIDEGVPVKGYLHWSLVDNYEWSSGFSARFGLMGMNFKTRETWWRPSAFVYREIAKTKVIDEKIRSYVFGKDSNNV